MATNESPTDMIEIEIDNFVSPNAANDVPADDFVALEIDAPIAMAPTEETPPVADVPTVRSVFADLASDLAAMSTPVQNATPTHERYIAPTSQGNAFDSSPLTDAEIAERDANRAARAARQAHARAVVTPTEQAQEAPILGTLDGAIVVESINERTCGMKLAWNPAEIARHSIPRAQLVEILTSAGMGNFAPGIPAEKGQFGKIMKSFNSMTARDARGDDNRLTATCVTRRHFEQLGQEWPSALESRYIVGHVDASPDLGSLGEKFLVCSLVEIGPDEYEVQFTGGNDRLRKAVSDKFATLTGTEAMDVTMLLKWYVACLSRKFNAVRCGYAMLIVDNGTDLAQANMVQAQALCDALQGSNLYGPSPVMGRRLETERVVSRKGPTWGSFCSKLGAGLLSDLADLEKEFSESYAAAQDAARKSEAKRPDATEESIELAARRALIGSDRVNSKSTKLLGLLDASLTRATAMVNVIGEHARPAIARCEAMRATWEPKCYGRSSNVLDMS